MNRMTKRSAPARHRADQGPAAAHMKPAELGGEPIHRFAGVILCGGKGTRMGKTRSHKVCEPIAGRPAIVRLVDALRSEGIDPIVIVVGHMAGDVMQAVGASHPGIIYTYQRDRLGTGHAARIGIDALGELGYCGPVLVTMGDKWLSRSLIDRARRQFLASKARLLLVTTPKRPESTAGRLVVLPRRGIVGIVERRDIERARVLHDWLALARKRRSIRRGELRRAGLKRIEPLAKLNRALGPLAGLARGSGSIPAADLVQAVRETGVDLQIADRLLGPDQVERHSRTVNESVYVGDLRTMQEALHRVGRDNAQDEFYLTDIVENIGAGMEGESPSTSGGVTELKAGPDEVLAFNTRTELGRIELHVRGLWHDRRERDLADRLAPMLATPQQWIRLLGADSRRACELIGREYGHTGSLVKSRIRALRQAVRLFTRTFGDDRRLLLVRAPGRVNLMGRHIDHQGGFVHSMALDCEIILAVSPRRDDVIKLVNADSVAFPEREIVISDWRAPLHCDNWMSFIDGHAVRTHLMSTAGDWSNYVLAAALHQQFHHPEHRMRGMDVAVVGDVPMAAGLSSSSSLVVAAMEAVNAVNAIDARPADVVDACGQAEWFVGSRGGAADHAAIRLGQAGHVARMGFHPFRLSRYVPIPPHAAILIAYSGQHAVKSAGARDRFNERVACYRIGSLLLKRQNPGLAHRIEYIRDLLPKRGHLTADQARELLASLPERITRAEIRRRLGPEYDERLEHIFSAHADPSTYTVRGVVAYGIGECERSRMAAGLLDRGDLPAFGEMMLLSHDGDRIAGPPAVRVDEDRPPLHRLVGAYGCSTEQIDQMVDIARSVPGVHGAQIAGAGLGGCIMVLADARAANRVKTALKRDYYEPHAIHPAIWNVRPVHGGGIIRPTTSPA